MKQMLLKEAATGAVLVAKKLVERAINAVLPEVEEAAAPLTTRKRGTGSIYKRGARYHADIKIKGKRHFKVFDSEADADAWLKSLIEESKNHVQEELPFDKPAETGTYAPVGTWVYNKKTKTSINTNKRLALTADDVVLDVIPFGDEGLSFLTGSVLYKPCHRSMLVVATAYKSVFCGGVTMPYTPEQLLKECWIFRDTGLPFGIILNIDDIK